MIILSVYLIFGILFNFIGPLAIHLKKEDNYTLKPNENKNWFYKYSLIVPLRIVGTITFPLFYFNYYIRNVKPIEPDTSKFNLNGGVIRKFRKIGKVKNSAPSDKTSDDKIIEIYMLVIYNFTRASIEKKPRIPVENLDIIALKFFNVYEEFGDDFLKHHLEYELNYFRHNGLRQEYLLTSS